MLMKKIKQTILFIGLFVTSCVWWDEKTSESDYQLVFQILPILEMDQSGYYELPITSLEMPITHQIYAYVGGQNYTTFDFVDFGNTAVKWYGNLFTINGDSLGYYSKRYGIDEDWQYNWGDSSIAYFGETQNFIPIMEPTVSMSNDSGLVSTFLNISPQIFQDTLILNAATFDKYDNCLTDTCFRSIQIIFKI